MNGEDGLRAFTCQTLEGLLENFRTRRGGGGVRVEVGQAGVELGAGQVNAVEERLLAHIDCQRDDSNGALAGDFSG